MRERTAVGVLAVALLVAVLLHAQEFRLIDVESASSSHADSSVMPQSSDSADDVVLIQGGVRVDHIAAKITGEANPYVPQHSQPQQRPTDISLVGIYSYHVSRIASVAMGCQTAVKNMIHQHLGETTKSTGTVAVVMLVLLICITCVAVVTIVYPRKVSGGDSAQAYTPTQPSVAAAMEQRDMIQGMRPGTQNGAALASNSYLRSPVQAGVFPGVARSPFATALNLGPTPAASLTSLPTPRLNSGGDQMAVYGGIDQTLVIPPPLCPRLVMPVCEARFGIPMYELAQLNAEGELHIVGLSGNPLLRAIVRKTGNARTLEIAMPEQSSASRATISPSSQEVAGHGQQGSRALEIRGIRGSFYGILEMHSSGACVVVKDGETVLTIDGDAGTLQLSIKSSVGMQLASVRCSAEPFGGVDHVEIRVEPAVDTILVVSVVLAVLLLSPYLAGG